NTSRNFSPAPREAAASEEADPVATSPVPPRREHKTKGVEVSSTRKLFASLSVVAFAVVVAAGGTAAAGKYPSAKAGQPVKVQVFAPRPGDEAGKASKGFFVDLALQYPSLASSGADFQLTGPATHQNQAPFPGAAAPGVDEKLPGLIVLLSTSTVGARN